jgi:serine/threonine protein kinase
VGATEERAFAIPGYELLDKVGEGGMGAVYRARQVSLQRVVAVKMLRVPATANCSALAFQLESRLLATSSHPNVLAIHDCIEHQDRFYLVTEFVPGTSLRELMQPGRPWPTARVWDLLDKVAGALSYIHQHGILHLDLKPENILCTPEGEIKIADFGLAQPQAEARAMVEQDQIQGTLDYCSLEQRHGLPTDKRSDLYSLAVVAYELLTGQLPGRAYENASAINRAMPAAADEVLRRALARRPEERQGSVDQFRRELTAALKPRSKRVTVSILSTAALLLVTLVLFLHYPRGSTHFSRAAPLAWLIGDDEESLSEFTEIANDPSERVASVLTTARQGEGDNEPPLPCWPSPRPVLCVKSAEGFGFFHPLTGLDSLKAMFGAWPAPVTWPAISPEDNFLLAGDFSGKRLWRPVNGPWDRFNRDEMKPGDGIDVACPPEDPKNPALLLDKSGSAVAEPLVCYQWIPRLPDPVGSVMVLRFRARSEIEKGRLSIGPTLPLYVPNDDRSSVAEQLRRRSKPHPYLPAKPGMAGREYRLYDWIQPNREWQTYCGVWEWPPYCTESNGRNVLIEYQGLGKVWVDDVELFTWERGSKR